MDLAIALRRSLSRFSRSDFSNAMGSELVQLDIGAVAFYNQLRPEQHIGLQSHSRMASFCTN